jgi:hypothetical protein
MQTFTVYIKDRKVGRVRAKDLEEAAKEADKRWKTWTDIYVVKKG